MNVRPFMDIEARMLRLRAAVLVPLLALSIAVPAAAPDRSWARVVSPNFVVYSDAGEATAAEIAGRLEAFRRLLETAAPRGATSNPDPLVVLAFSNDAAMTPFKPLYGGRPANKSGFHLSAAGRDLVMLDVAAGRGDLRVVMHEYTHRVLSLRRGPVPLWLNEGLAELYSTATETPEGFEIGAPIESHLELLRERPALAIEDLVAVTPESAEYNERSLQSGFYAHAWGLAHYLTFGQGAPERLEAFLKRLAAGEPQLEALAAAWGGLDVLAREVRSHVLRPGLPRRVIPLAAPPASPVASGAAPRAEVEAYLGLALVLQRRREEAKSCLERAIALDPSAALPYEALGLDALLADEPTRARGMFREAIARDSRSYRAHYYFALVALEIDDETSEAAVRDALARAVELQPMFDEPYALLSRLARREGDFDKALRWAERGLAIAPEDGAGRLALAFAQIAKRRYAEGEASLRHVLASVDDFNTRESARVALRSLERYLAAARTAPGGARVDVPLGVFEELPPWLHLAAAGVRGRLESLECTDTTMTARVRVGGRRFSYSTSEAAGVYILTLKHAGTEVIDCNRPIDREAIVEFEPDIRDPSTGTLRAVIFLTPKIERIILRPAQKP